MNEIAILAAQDALRAANERAERFRAWAHEAEAKLKLLVEAVRKWSESSMVDVEVNVALLDALAEAEGSK